MATAHHRDARQGESESDVFRRQISLPRVSCGWLIGSLVIGRAFSRAALDVYVRSFAKDFATFGILGVG